MTNHNIVVVELVAVDFWAIRQDMMGAQDPGIMGKL